jgi:hypothetical protein
MILNSILFVFIIQPVGIIMEYTNLSYKKKLCFVFLVHIVFQVFFREHFIFRYCSNIQKIWLFVPINVCLNKFPFKSPLTTYVVTFAASGVQSNFVFGTVSLFFILCHILHKNSFSSNVRKI